MLFIYKMATQGFADIIKIRSDIVEHLAEIHDKLYALHSVYATAAKQHNDQVFSFGLDTLQFQNQLIQLDYDNLQRSFQAIDNRVYCEYYKLYRMASDYVLHEVKEKSIHERLLSSNKTFPVYKDLEPTKVYDMALVEDLHTVTCNIIHDLQALVDQRESRLVLERRQSAMGLNVDTLLNVQEYSNRLMTDRIHLFMRFLETFNQHQTKYYSRLAIKCKLMLGIVNDDIRLKLGAGHENYSVQTPSHESTHSSTRSSRCSKADIAVIKHLVTTKEQQLAVVQEELDQIVATISESDNESTSNSEPEPLTPPEPLATTRPMILNI